LTAATVLVKVRFLDKGRRMLPDMSAKVSFLPHKLAPEEIKPRLAAGRSALIDRNGSTFAYLLEGNRVRETPVRVGATFGDRWRFTPSPFTKNPACWLEAGRATSFITGWSTRLLSKGAPLALTLSAFLDSVI